jgi:hypothetical protein
VSSEVDVLAVVNYEVITGARVGEALASAIDNRAQKVIMGSVHATVAVNAASSTPCYIQDE